MTQRSSAKGKKRRKKPEKLEFVQDFIPIKDLRHGIIETTDGRYIKILEIEPINFMLRSDDEQFSIISTFASWLKISPMKLQFKSITRRADSDKHVAMVREELEAEPSEECKRLGEDYINLIKDVGSREALTRRFFLIFQYEEIRRSDSDDFSQIFSMMQTAEQNARAYFMQCGNNILQPEDPDEATAEILYMFFNRRSCIDEPFSSRVERVVVDTMAAKNKIIGIDEVPHIRFAHFIAPRGIDLKHHNYVIIDGLYYTFLYIKGDGYPSRVRAGWMSALINAGEGVDIDVHLRRENRSKTIDKVAQRIRLNRTKIKSMQDTSTDYEELANSIQAGYYIKHGIANYNEDLFYMSVFITISAKTYEELMWRKQQMVDMLKSMDMYVSDCRFQQETALRSVMPFLKIAPSLEKKAKRNVLTSGAASTYMFTSYELSDDTGVLLGINRHNNSLCIVDLFNTKRNKNANLNLIGTSGAGKTFTLQLLALRMRMRGIQCFILAPIKGHEFRRACNAVGGQFIRIAPGSPHCINIMEIRHTIAPEMERIDAMDYVELGSMLANKIQQLMIFFSLLIPDMTNEEEQLLDEALIKTYADFGITHDNESVYEDATVTPPKMKQMPILGDLHKHLLENKMTERIAVIVSRFVTGSAQSFNRQTNVDLSNKYIVFDLSELKGKLLPVGMMIALDDVIQGVEKTGGDYVAVLYHGDFKVIIPALEAIIPPNDYRDLDPNAVHKYMLTKRLGAELDYIVKGIDPQTGMAVASRLEAMKARQKQYYLSRDRDGNNLLYEGVLAEGRITSVIKAGIFVDLFGVEVYISMKELSYQRWIDASEYYRPGQRVIVRILSVDRSDRNNIKVKASVKQAKENPYEKALKRFVEGNQYVGTVSMVDENGVFVAMDGGIDCLCEYPRRGRPPIGSRVTVRVIGINRSTNRMWGAITHTTTAY